MSSKDTENDDEHETSDSENGTSSYLVGGLSLAAGALIGAGLTYFFGNRAPEPQCHTYNSNSGSGRNTSRASSSTYQNRKVTCEMCTVCLKTISGVTVLPCSHRFHTSCVTRWFQESNTCPTCRSEAPKHLVQHH